MRYLFCVSGLLLLVGCAPRAYKDLVPVSLSAHCIQEQQPAFNRVLYKASIAVTSHYLSGILLIKQMPDSSQRLVFTNEAGYRFFDFEFSKLGDFKVLAITPQMNKSAVINTLKKDFELILMNQLGRAHARVYQKDQQWYYAFTVGKDVYYYITDAPCGTILGMERGSSNRKVLHAQISSLKSGVPDSIQIKHTNFKFTIDLNRIYDHADG